MHTDVSWEAISIHLTGLAHLATVTAGGDPHVSVVSPAIDGDTIWIGASTRSQKVRNLVANPRAALMWQPGAEAYVRGDAIVVSDVETKVRLWGTAWAYDAVAFFGSPDHPEYALIRVRPTSASVVTGGPEGHGRLNWQA